MKILRTNPAWPSGEPQGFAVLLICTANECRSPMAEFLLRDALAARGLDWTVGSSGIRAVAGRGMHPSAAAVLAERGIEVGDWVSTPTTAAQIARADLVLTATARQRGQAATLSPAALPRAFTILQFARLADAADPVAGPALTDLVAAAAAARSRVQSPATPLDDLADPIGLPRKAFDRTAAVLDGAIARILAPMHRPR